LKENRQLSINYFGASDIGLVRTENQDCFGKFPNDNSNMYQPKGVLFVVADGMGGHSGGKEASQTAVDVVSKEYYSFSSEVISSALLYAFKTANFKINRSSQDSLQFRKKGTTCSALVIENDKAHIAHVGDSKIYKISDGNIIQFTNDHTEVGEMVRKKILSEEEAKNHPSKSVLIRAMGIEADLEVDLIENILITGGDSFVLCSDGLAKVSPEEIKQIVLDNSEETACKKLIALANERGGHDNVTVQVVKIISNDIEVVPQGKTVVKNNNNKLYIIFISIVVITLIALLGLVFQKEIMSLFSKKSNTEVDKTLIEDNVISTDDSEMMLVKADEFLQEGNLDSALVLYNLILIQNPLHVSALNGKEQVITKYILLGNEALTGNRTDDALLNFKKAFALEPNDKELYNKIMAIQKTDQTTVKDNKKPLENKNQQKVQNNNQSIQESNNESLLSFSSINLNEWDHSGMTEHDFKSKGKGFLFLNTNKSKKLIYKQPMEDIDINVNLRFDDHPNSKAGVIVGYNKAEHDGIEYYYLFSVNSAGNYSLLRIMDGKDDILVTGKQNLDTSKKVFYLKIKCLGPWIMLYNDNKLLESYLSSDFISGRFGLYADSNSQVEFEDLIINSAFEKK
jgi:PPM family protein phosphatase